MTAAEKRKTGIAHRDARVKLLFSGELGRQVLADIAAKACLQVSPFNRDNERLTAYNIGQQDFARWLIALAEKEGAPEDAS